MIADWALPVGQLCGGCPAHLADIVVGGLSLDTADQHAEEPARPFLDLDYQIAPIRNLVPQPHIVSLYVTSFVIEQLIKHKDVVDIFGSDEEIYFTINEQVKKFLPQ